MAAQLALYIAISLIGAGLFMVAGMTDNMLVRTIVMVIAIPMWLGGLFLFIGRMVTIIAYTDLRVVMFLVVMIIAFVSGLRQRGRRRIVVAGTAGILLIATILTIIATFR